MEGECTKVSKTLDFFRIFAFDIIIGWDYSIIGWDNSIIGWNTSLLSSVGRAPVL